MPDHPSWPAELVEKAARHLVWVCAGCDECDPPDGSERSPMPCNGPSHNGAWVVKAERFDALKRQADALAEALEETVRVLDWSSGVGHENAAAAGIVNTYLAAARSALASYRSSSSTEEPA